MLLQDFSYVFTPHPFSEFILLLPFVDQAKGGYFHSPLWPIKLDCGGHTLCFCFICGVANFYLFQMNVVFLFQIITINNISKTIWLI